MTLQMAGRLADRTGALGDRCPLDRALGAVGNRSALLLVREVLYGATRFDDLAARVGITDAVAAQRLRELVEVGVLEKRPYREPGQRTRHEYVLTESGHELLPVVLALGRWGARHVPGPAPSLTHDGCGEPVELVARCRAGHEVAEEAIVMSG